LNFKRKEKKRKEKKRKEKKRKEKKRKEKKRKEKKRKEKKRKVASAFSPALPFLNTIRQQDLSNHLFLPL